MKTTLKWIKPTEKEIENAVLTYLNYRVGCFAFKVNTTGVYDQRGGFYRKLSRFVMAGTPDILCCLNIQGLPIFVGFEVKAEGGRQSQDQRDFQEKLDSKSQGFYFIVRTIADVEHSLEQVTLKINRLIAALQEPGPVLPTEAKEVIDLLRDENMRDS